MRATQLRKSIRWNLLVLYSLIALTMATVFGSLTYLNVRYATYRVADLQLADLAQGLAAVLTEDDERTFLVELTNGQLDAFQRDYSQLLYYRMWNERQSIIDTSHPTMEIPVMRANGSRTRNGCRELSVNGPSGSRILVGRKIPREVQQLNVLAATSFLVGVLVLVAMLGGGWYLIGRALEPIHRISQAAARVSESTISERIDVSTMESELSNLSQAINDAFDRLQYAVERQTRFTADASHELRTPLSIIIAHADGVLKCPRSPAEYQEVLHIVQKSAKRMQGMADGLLMLARCDSFSNAQNMGPLRFDEIVEEACDSYQHLAAQKSIRLDVNASALLVFGNPSLLTEAISNLVANAIKYAPFEGCVSVQLARVEDSAVLTVSDNGPGISSEDQPFVFDRFFRADNARTSDSHGSIGLGLAIVKSIVEMHKGTVTLFSQLGSGAVFKLHFALFDERQTQEQSTTDKEIHRKRTIS